jgi:excisionase family DNA binding protein
MGQLLKTGDVALRLRVSATYVRRLADTGVLTPVKAIGGYRLFDAEEVERLATEREARKVLQGRARNARKRK